MPNNDATGQKHTSTRAANALPPRVLAAADEPPVPPRPPWLAPDRKRDMDRHATIRSSVRPSPAAIRSNASAVEAGLGTVYEATQLGLDRRVAIKILRPDASVREGALERFRHEAQLAAQLQHPNIVVVHDFDVTSDGNAYIAMEYLPGLDARRMESPRSRAARRRCRPLPHRGRERRRGAASRLRRPP